MNKYKYPLQTDPFTLLDRLKVCAFVLSGKRLTMGDKVAEFEDAWSKFSDTSVAVATSSGSTANVLLIETFLQTYNYNPKDVTVYVPATTWASSVTPWIQRGCKVVFVDINLDDLSFNYESLEGKLRASKAKVKVLWPTALIGSIPDISCLRRLARNYQAYLFADLCETSFGKYNGINILGCFDMCTTSTFFAHEVTSIEGGILFINKGLINADYNGGAIKELDIARMTRNHGLVRSINNQESFRIIEENPDIDPQFLFETIGNNYRMTDLHAKFGLLDFKRIDKYIKHRDNIWAYFVHELPSKFFIPKGMLDVDVVPFCLPFIFKDDGVGSLTRFKNRFKQLGFETRPIIANLPQHKPFKQIAGKGKFPNSDYLSRNGFYVGLSGKLKIKDLANLFEETCKL